MSRNNGAYWYAKEIEEIILPEVGDLNLYINTVGALLYDRLEVPQGAVIVCHDNVNTIKTYIKLFRLGILWVCSKQSVADLLKEKGETAVYIPLSVDTHYVAKFKRKKKTEDNAYIGNAWAFKKNYLESLPDDVDQIYGLERDDLLTEMSKYKNVIAEGRCLIEAKVLGCKTSRPTYEAVNVIDREVFDTREAIPLWKDVLESHSKTMKGKCILRSMKSFKDVQAKRHRRINEVFTVAEERAEELLSHKMKLVERL